MYILLTQTQLGSVTVNWGPLSLMGSVAVTWGPSPSFGVRHRKLGSVMVDGKNVRPVDMWESSNMVQSYTSHEPHFDENFEVIFSASSQSMSAAACFVARQMWKILKPPVPVVKLRTKGL